MSLSSCGCGGCGCNVCQPANTIYRGTCVDPGTIDFGSYLAVFDPSFCGYRLAAGEGIVQSRENGSGNFQITITESPQVDIPTAQAVAGVAIPNLMVINQNDAWLELLAPASANLFLTTNAAGQLLFTTLPAATVPDPLTIGTINVTTAATIAALTLTGAMTASGIASGTPTTILGLDGSNNVVKQTVATAAVQTAMFFESPTMPNASSPNEMKVAGENLIIGNQIYDSGGTILTVTDSVTLTVAQAGKYTIEWGGTLRNIGGSNWFTGMLLVINGILVSNGNTQTKFTVANAQNTVTAAGVYSRTLAVGDTIRLQLFSGATANARTYEVFLNATRLSA